MATSLYQQYRATANQYVAEARTRIVPQATDFIEHHNRDAAEPLLQEITNLAVKLLVLFGGNEECAKIPLKDLYYSSLYRKIKNVALRELNQQTQATLSNNNDVEDTDIFNLSNDDKLQIQQSQRTWVESTSGNSTTVRCFKDSFYRELGQTTLDQQLHPKKRKAGDNGDIETIFTLFQEELFHFPTFRCAYIKEKNTSNNIPAAHPDGIQELSQAAAVLQSRANRIRENLFGTGSPSLPQMSILSIAPSNSANLNTNSNNN